MKKELIEELREKLYSFEDIKKIDESIEQSKNWELYDFYDVYNSVINNWKTELCTK